MASDDSHHGSESAGKPAQSKKTMVIDAPDPDEGDLDDLDGRVAKLLTT